LGLCCGIFFKTNFLPQLLWHFFQNENFATGFKSLFIYLKIKERDIDYYQYLIFKIENGQLKEILP
jgi:hypothetical protein